MIRLGEEAKTVQIAVLSNCIPLKVEGKKTSLNTLSKNLDY